MDASVFLQRNKNAILNLAIVILVLIISIKIYYSQDAQITALKMQKEKEIENSKVFNRLTALNNKINVYKRSLKITNAGEVMNTISEAAKSAGLKIDAIRPLGQAVGDDYIKLPVSVNLRTKNFDQIGKFMSKLENHPVFFTIDSFRISHNGEGKELTLDLTASVIRVTD